MYLLGIDTCGPSGSVALARLAGSSAEAIAEIELAGRTYSATLVSAIEGLLEGQGISLRDTGCIVVVHGPGSFTGVRVGLAAAKGLAEGAGIPIAPVSRLEVLAAKADVCSAALDAHRHEVFLRVADPGGQENARELLAGGEELARLNPPSRIAVCDGAAEALLQQAWPAVRLVQVPPPAAADAIKLAARAVAAGNFADVALLDGHYLRRSDAEIFGNTVTNR
jgi:tRNA threonylcarbamoyladenosine biosynthesis protein TsaB